jgi:hypothetical protein
MKSSLLFQLFICSLIKVEMDNVADDRQGKLDFMKANLICGILAINLLTMDKAIECFKQIDLEEESEWHLSIANEEDLAFYGVLVSLSCQTYSQYRELVEQL